MFFIFALIILWIIHGYVAIRFISPFDISFLKSFFFYSIVFILSIIPILPLLLRMNGGESKLLDKFSLIGYTSLGFFTLSFFLFLTKDFFYQIVSIYEKLFQNIEPIVDSKRDFLKKAMSIGMISLAGSASLYGFRMARDVPSIIYKNIYLKNLPDEFEKFKIAQISDLHVGPTIKKPYVESVLTQISYLNPDLIAITGDLVDGSVKHLKSELEPMAEMIAPYGTFFVTGNHEYYSGVDQWLDETDRLGMKNLINTNEILTINDSKIVLAGVTDYRAHQIKPSHKTNPKKALEHLPNDILKIVLAHQPASIFKIHEAGADLQLSGHTHGGQFWPFTYPTKWANPYLEGLHDHNGTQIYVNKGTGYWGPPLRLGVSSEITLIQLRKI